MTHFETLENRQLLSAAAVPAATGGALASSAVVQKHTRHRTAATTQNFVIAFYGLGGGGFGNDWLGRIADGAGTNTGSVVRKYQQDQGNAAVLAFLKSVDTDGDHAISTAEIANVNVRVVGYSYGAIQGSEFTRYLVRNRRGTLGYRLSGDIPVKDLVTIDPVNYTPQKHTDGPLSNVQNFVSYYQLNPGSSTIQLLNKSTSQKVSSVKFTDGIDPVGGTLASSAVQTHQTLVDFGSWASRSVTQYYNHSYNGTMKGSEVNHLTMPWYLYGDAIAALA